MTFVVVVVVVVVVGNESFEKLASMSLVANITVYLRTRYNLEGVLLVNAVQIWSGTCNIMTLLGAFLSDAYLGRFKTLLLGSVFSLLVFLLILRSYHISQYTLIQPKSLTFLSCGRFYLAMLDSFSTDIFIMLILGNGDRHDDGRSPILSPNPL